MSTCPTCVGRPVLGVVAHYGWCSEAGGPGYRYDSVRAMQDEVRRLAAEKAQREAEEAERQASNNGWVKYRGDERSYSGLTLVTERPEIETVHHHTEYKVRHRRTGVPRPGKEIGSKEVRRLLNLAIDEGWDYVLATHPYVKDPKTGAIVNGSSSSSDVNAQHMVRRALRNAGVAV